MTDEKKKTIPLATPSQTRILQQIEESRSLPASLIPTKMREKLLELGWIEENARHYFGPRAQTFRLTTEGRLALRDARDARSGIILKGIVK